MMLRICEKCFRGEEKRASRQRWDVFIPREPSLIRLTWGPRVLKIWWILSVFDITRRSDSIRVSRFERTRVRRARAPSNERTTFELVRAQCIGRSRSSITPTLLLNESKVREKVSSMIHNGISGPGWWCTNVY